MRSFTFSVVALLSIVALDQSQAAAAEPQFRPALIGNGTKALVNLVDTKKLMKKGQGNGALSFQCFVSTWGGASDAVTYRGTPGSNALQEEVMSALRRCRFTPAIYDSKPTAVMFLGTVLFVVVDGRPHLRIYANQNRDDIARENDFIAPQLIAGTAQDVALPQDELVKGRIYHQKGVVELAITVDENGNQKNANVLREDPVGFNFGHATLTLLRGAKFIPGFRNGQAVDCTFDCHISFRAARG